MFTDLRFVFRTLFRNRTFTLVTVFTLALGIGAAAAIFSVADYVLFRANKFPDRVYLVGGRTDTGALMPVRFDYMMRAYEQTTAMDEYGKAAFVAGNIVIKGQPVATSWLGVSPNLFNMLGVTPALGRGFLPGEGKDGADNVVIVSDHFWHQFLGGSPDVLGSKITMGDTVCTIVGVLRTGQVLPMYFMADVFRPLVYRVNPQQPWLPQLWLLGKLRQGVSPEQAQAMLSSVKLDVPAPLREYVAKDRVALSTLSQLNQSLINAGIYWMMLGAVGFLYAIACLNVSNLVLVRMLGQRRELSIRLALGGGLWRVFRLLVLESVTLALLGALAGALVASWLFPLLLRAAGTSFGGMNWSGWLLNWRVIGLLGGLTILTSLFIVVVPVIRLLRTDIHAGLKDGGGALGESRALGHVRAGFVVLQAAFAVVLLCGAGLMVRTFQNLRSVNLGFDPSDKVKMQITFPPSTPTEIQARLARLREVEAVLLRTPGVRAVGFGNDIVLPGYYFPNVELVGPGGDPLKASVSSFGNGFQDAAGLTLKRGQWLTHKKGDDILVNEALARVLWPKADPVGQFVRTVNQGPGTPRGWQGWRVVGVVGDIRANMRESPGLCVYGPETWAPFNFNTFVVRLTRKYDEAFAGTLRRELYAYDPQLVVDQILPLSQVRDQQLWAEHLTDSVLKVLSGMAALLTVVGMFSVLAYTVDCRMSEFGVRLALGATRGHLMTLVMRRSLLLAAVGLAIGIGATFGLTRYLQSLLYRTSAQDPLMLAAVGTILIATSVLACALPAYRATKADVVRLLRSE